MLILWQTQEKSMHAKKTFTIASTLTIIFGSIITLGGVMGFIFSKSIVSLIMSLGFGSLLYFSAYLLKKQKQIGLTLSVILAIILDGFFTYRFLTTYSIFPALIFAMICTLFLGSLVYVFSKR